MRKLFSVLALGSMMMSGAATAAPVVTTYTFGLTLQGIGAVSFSGIATVDVTGSTVTIAAGQISNAAPIVVPVTATTAVGGISIAAGALSNATGTFSPGGAAAAACPGVGAKQACVSGGGIGGGMGVNGLLKLTAVLGLFNLTLPLTPLNIGNGPGTGMTAVGALAVTAINGLFTTNSAFVLTTNATATGTGGNAPLVLVAPAVIDAGLSGTGFTLPTVIVLELDDVSLGVPEPAPPLLIGLGIAGLVLLGLKREGSPK